MTAIQPSRHDKFASRVFWVAGFYGLAVLLPQYFMERILSRQFPPALTHPEHFYGFIGVAIAWQFVFLIIARDLQRFRILILPAILEKVFFGIPAFVLYAQGRASPVVPLFGAIDLSFATCFVLAFIASRPIREQ